MRVRHIVAEENVDEMGVIRDPTLVRHGLIYGGHIADLAGAVDPLTHLNLDFPEHRIAECIMAERLQVGAMVFLTDDVFRTAKMAGTDLRHFGSVPVAQRRQEWLRATLKLSQL